MKTFLSFLFFIVFSNIVLGQTWVTPRPTIIYPPTQSLHFNTTNVFVNSFYLGGTNGLTGYFIWNGVRINNPSDLAVAVSNSVAPTSFVFKVDFNVYTNSVNTAYNSLSNLIINETSARIASDAAISNQLAFVPTNAVIQYINSNTNFLSWTNNGKTWFFNVCLTNGIGAGGFGGTNIINITNTVVAGTTYVTNFFDLSFTNTTSFILTNAFYSTVTNNIIVTNHNDFNIGSINTVVSNTFAPVNSNTVINNNIITNLFQPSNNFNPNVNVTNVFVSNVNSYPQNNITNNVTVGSTTVSNEFFITNNITVGSVIVTNNNTVTNSFSPINNVSNVISFTNTFQITNNLSVFTTNLINNSNSFTSVNNISNVFTFGDTIVTNLFDITNNITIEGVVVTNNIITTNNFSPGIDITFSPTITNIVENSITNNITNSFIANISNTNLFTGVVTNYVTVTNLVIVYATNIVEAINVTNENIVTASFTNNIESINITNLNTFAPTNIIDISNNVVVGATTLILSNTFNTVVSNTIEGVVNNITNIINNITQVYTSYVGGVTNVFTSVNSSSNYISWVSNSVDGFISYNEFCVTNGGSNPWTTDVYLNSSIIISNEPTFGPPGTNALKFIQTRYGGVLQITNYFNADGMTIDHIVSGTSTNSFFIGNGGIRSTLSGTNYQILSKGGPIWFLGTDNTNYPVQVLTDAKSDRDIVNYRTATNLIDKLGSKSKSINILNFSQTDQISITGVPVSVYDDGPVTQQTSKIDFTVYNPDVTLIPLDTIATNFIISTNTFAGNFSDPITNAIGAYIKLLNVPGYFPIFNLIGDGTNAESVTISRPMTPNTTNVLQGVYGTLPTQGSGLVGSSAIGNPNGELWFSFDTFPNFPISKVIPLETNLFYVTIPLGALTPVNQGNRVGILRVDSPNNYKFAFIPTPNYANIGYSMAYAWESNKIVIGKRDINQNGVNYLDFLYHSPLNYDLNYYITNNLLTNGVSSANPVALVYSINTTPSGKIILAGRDGTQNLQLSTNFGGTWTSIASAGARIFLAPIIFDEQGLTQMVFTITAPVSGLYTTNRWASFATNSPHTNFSLSSAYLDAATDGTNAIVTTTGGNAYLSRDYGRTWYSMYIGNLRYVMYAHGIWTLSGGGASSPNPGTLPAEIWVSTNFFDNYTIHLSNDYQPIENADYTALDISADGRYIFYARTGGLVYRYDQINKVNQFIASVNTAYEISTGPNGELSIGSRGQHVQSKNNGESWTTAKIYGQDITDDNTSFVYTSNKIYKLQPFQPLVYSTAAEYFIAEANNSTPDQWVVKDTKWFENSSLKTLQGLAYEDGKLYTVFENKNVMVSEDQGETWKISSLSTRAIGWGVNIGESKTTIVSPVFVRSNVVYSAVRLRVDVQGDTTANYKQANYTGVYRYKNMFTSSNSVEIIKNTESVGGIATIDNETIWLANATNLLVSRDAGSTWSIASSALAGRNLTGVATLDNTNIYVVAYTNNIYKSTNGGTNFTAIFPGITGSNQYVGINMPNENHIVIWGRNGYVWETKNGGTDWYEYVLTGIGSALYDLVIDPTDTNIVYRYGDGLQFSKSTNGVNGTYTIMPSSNRGLQTRGSTAYNQHIYSSLAISPIDPNYRIVTIYSTSSQPGNSDFLISTNGYDYYTSSYKNSAYTSVRTKDGVIWTIAGSAGRNSLISTDNGITFSNIYRRANTGAGVTVSTFPSLFGFVADPLNAGQYWVAEDDGRIQPMRAFGERSFYTNYAPSITTWSSVNWDAITDTLANIAQYAGSDAYFVFGFDSTNKFNVYHSGAWVEAIINTNNQWKYWNGSAYINTPQFNSMNEAIQNAMSFSVNRKTYNDVTGISPAAWGQKLPVTNLNVGIVLKSGNQPIAVKDFSFIVDYAQGTISRERDGDYEITIDTNLNAIITRKASGTVNTKVYYLEGN